MANTSESSRLHDGLPLLGGIAAAIRWLEALIALLAGPLLTLGLGIALIDLMTGGRLLTTFPWLLWLWSASQAVGLDAQLVGTFDRCRTAIRERRWLATIGLLLLGGVLGYVGFLSASAFGFQQAFNMSEADALARLGIDGVMWQLQRAALAVFLVALSGYTRYHRPAMALEDEKADLLRELELEPLRQRAREMKAAGAVGVVQAVRQAALGKRPKRAAGTNPNSASAIESGERPALAVVKSPRERVYAVLNRTPQASKSVIAQRAGVSETTAGKYRREWMAERGLIQEHDAAE